MQVRTERRVFNVGGEQQKPTVTVAIAPKTVSSYLFVGLGLGLLLGFIAGSVMTLLVGDKSLLLVQQLWSRLTGTGANGERVHFELLLQ